MVYLQMDDLIINSPSKISRILCVWFSISPIDTFSAGKLGVNEYAVFYPPNGWFR